MNVASFLAKMPRPPSDRLHRLNEIADVLGVSVDAFIAPAQPYVLHTGEDGTRWLLTTDTQGVPVVRCTHDRATGYGTTEESVSDFLIRNAGTTQHQMLAALIDRLLTGHFAGLMLSRSLTDKPTE